MIRMKKIYQTILILLSAAAFSACDDFLDQMPDNRAELDSEEKITKLLVTAYPQIHYCMMAEFASDNTDDNGSKYSSYNRLEDDLFAWRDTYEAGDDSPLIYWIYCYTAIATANQALEAIDKMGNPPSLSAQRGEALLCRALGHFMLSYIFCEAYSEKNKNTALGIPYITKPETTVNPQYERGTIGETYEKIAKDLEEGIPLINDDLYTVPKYHFNKKAAYAFATRFYLYYGQYAKAIEYANNVLGENVFLTTGLRDWSAIGALSKNENIQPDAYVDSQNPANLLLLSTYSFWGYTHGPYSPTCKYTHNSTIANDETCFSHNIWGDSLQQEAASYSIPKVIMRKLGVYFEYIDYEAGNGYIHGVLPIFTTDEVLLERAEAYTLLGGEDNYDYALSDLTIWMLNYTKWENFLLFEEDINDFYDKLAYYTPNKPTIKKRLHPDFEIEYGGTQENLLHTILQARRVMTLHEGLRWGDIKRYGITVYRRTVENRKITVTDSLVAGDPRRAIQLPSDVISAGLKPNPRPKGFGNTEIAINPNNN